MIAEMARDTWIRHCLFPINPEILFKKDAKIIYLLTTNIKMVFGK
jgi:hypothetical protein